MGKHVFKLPDVGEGVVEGEIVDWKVKAGDSVIEDQPLVDLMTDKATVAIPSPVSGKVISTTGKPGDMVAVGAELIVFEVEGKGKEAEPEPEVTPEPEPAPEPEPEPITTPEHAPIPAAAAAPPSLPPAQRRHIVRAVCWVGVCRDGAVTRKGMQGAAVQRRSELFHRL